MKAGWLRWLHLPWVGTSLVLIIQGGAEPGASSSRATAATAAMPSPGRLSAEELRQLVSFVHVAQTFPLAR